MNNSVRFKHKIIEAAYISDTIWDVSFDGSPFKNQIIKAEIEVYRNGASRISGENITINYEDAKSMFEEWDVIGRRVLIEKTGCL